MSGSRTLQAAIFIAALSSCIAAPAFAEPAPAPLHLQVTVCDRASVDQIILSAAKVVTADAYRRIGVIIDWSDAGCIAGAPGVYVNLTSGGAERVNFANVTLGFAESGMPADMALLCSSAWRSSRGTTTSSGRFFSATRSRTSSAICCCRPTRTPIRA